MKDTKVSKTISNLINTKVQNVPEAINVFVNMTFGVTETDKDKRDKNTLKMSLLSEYLLQTTKEVEVEATTKINNNEVVEQQVSA